MNLIVCDQNCRHQQDGYCALDQMTRLTSSAQTKCGYYQSAEEGNADTELAAAPDSLR